jgi:hypothetical protein
MIVAVPLARDVRVMAHEFAEVCLMSDINTVKATVLRPTKVTIVDQRPSYGLVAGANVTAAESLWNITRCGHLLHLGTMPYANLVHGVCVIVVPFIMWPDSRRVILYRI